MRQGAVGRWALLLACVPFAVAGCGGRSSKASPPTTASQTSTTLTTSTTSATEAAVLAAYQDYWKAWLAANNPPDQFNSDLKTFSTGTAYKHAFDAIQLNRLQGRSIRLPENPKYAHRAEVVAVTADTATVRDCNVDDALTVKTDTNEVVNGTVATKLIKATMTMTEGRWTLSDSTVEQRWEGVTDCGSSS